MTTERAVSDSSAFEHLGDEVRAALAKRGFTEPTEPQRLAIPSLARGTHGLVIAPTGTGKTETAMLPVLDAISKAEPRFGVSESEANGGSEGGRRTPFGVSALYITPLRALNRDMRERLEWWGEELGLDIDVRHGDTTQYQRGKQANDPPDVLVTTPETLQAMLTGSKLRKALSDVAHVVVDEVHELASAKRGAQLSVGLERLVELAGEFQRIGLSATVGDPKEVGRFLTGDRGCEVIEVDIGSLVEFDVVEPAVTEEDEKLARRLMTDPDIASHVRAILDLVEANESSLIFVNTRQTAEALGSRFKELDANVGVHHGSLSKEARIEVEDAFKAGDVDALLCTSSMELGIDVGRINHVIQYSSPREVARLLQRVGRAGHRMDEVSRGTIVTGHPDDTLESLAIARRAKQGDVEPAQIHDGSLDTVANQIVGLVMDFGEVGAMRAYDLVTRAYPFRDLSEEAFKQVVREIASNRIIWLDEEADRLEKTGGTWQYYYANLSMIPDEETFEVHDMASGRQVGTLDERFVVNFAAPGEVFIQRGEMWRIAEIDEEESRVNVSPIEDPAGEVPSWTGQEIPVPFEVAQEVGEMRDVAGAQFRDVLESEALGSTSGTQSVSEDGAPLAGTAERSSASSQATLDDVVRDLTTRYPTDEYTAGEALSHLEEHVEAGDPLPTDDRIVVEYQGTKIVVNACFGHKVNETIGRTLSALLGQRTGSSVGMEISPYRIELDVPPKVTGHDVVEVLETTDPEHVATIIELSLKNSDVLKFKLSQVAAKFGALKRWQGRKNFGLDRLLAALSDTPMYDEAVREVFHENLDVDGMKCVLERIQEDETEVVAVGGRTAIGTGGRSSGRELLAPENADASVIRTVKERIQNDRVILCCTHCTEWSRKTKVKRVADQPECPECGSTRVAALKPWEDDYVQAVQAQEKSEEQVEMTKRAFWSASLVQSHGKQAVIALAARGVGPRNTTRIINKLRDDEDEFYRDILAQEREYARTNAFW